MEIKIKDLSSGNVYSNNMSSQNTKAILSINFCTSYTEVEVQDEIDEDGKRNFPKHTIILPANGISLTDVNWVDLIAIQDCARGEWVTD